MKQAQEGKQPLWVKAPVANLVRYTPSGIYFARAKVGGRLVRQSLKTDVLSTAKLRLRDLLADEQKKVERQRTITVGKMTFADALEIYQGRMEKDPDIKKRTKTYKKEILKALDKSWPELGTMDMKRITKADFEDWRLRFGAEYSATRVNGALTVLRRAFEVAIDAGIRQDNPIAVIRRAKVRSKELVLPEPEQFQKFLAELENGGARESMNCANLVRFLAYGGFRITEAANIIWADCDFTRHKITVRGDPETGTKNSETREVPMIPDMRQLLENLRAQRPEDGPEQPVMRVSSCQKSMKRAAAAIGMRYISHHDLRHLFATRCIESGVDIPTVSRWLGHKDGGALAMKVYGHLRDAHSADMARRVRFSATRPADSPLPTGGGAISGENPACPSEPSPG